MTSEHPLRRFLARVCSPETMSRIVDPILADIRWEDGRITWRGCVPLVKALAMLAMTSLPRWGAALWTDDDYAMPRAAGFLVLGAVSVGVLLILPPLSGAHHPDGLSLPSYAILLMPQAFALSVPMAVIAAIAAASRRSRMSARLMRRTLMLSGLVVAMTFAIITWAVPDANQAFRESVARAVNGRPVTLTPGPNEMHWTVLRQQIGQLRRSRDGYRAAAQMEYAYQLRLAIVVAAIPLGLSGLAIGTSAFGRRRPLLISVAVLATYWALLMIEERTAKTLMSAGGFIPEYVCPWTPNLIVLFAAGATLLSRRSLQPPTAPASRVV